MQWALLPLRRYFEFNGRSRRKEFWHWILFLCIAYLILPFFDATLGLGGDVGRWMQEAPGLVAGGVFTRGGTLTGLFWLVTLIPGLAVSVRRLHDGDRSGWWLLFMFLPVIGWTVLIVFFILEGTGGPNRFGPDPLVVEE